MAIKTEFIQVCTLKEAMQYWRGNQTQAAKELGINRGSLSGYLKDEKDRLLKVTTSGALVVGFEFINKG